MFDDNKPNLYEKVNCFRTTPETFSHKFDIVSKALSRTKKNSVESLELQEIRKFISENKNLNLEPFSLSYGLCKTAEAIIRTVIQTGNQYYSITKDSISKIASTYLTNHVGLFYICDHGDLEHFIVRMLISTYDPDRTYKKAIFSKDLKYIGFASREYQEEELNIVLLAEDIEEKHVSDEETELKEIFDILDQNGNELIDPFAIKEAMLALQFDIKNFKFVEMFEKFENIVKKQKDYKGIDFQTFKEIITSYYVNVDSNKRSKSDYRKIFEIFVDDSESNTISINNLKRISLHLDENLNSDELKKFMKWISSNGSELNFEEFYKIMTTNC